jgi:hypothetical protein
LERWRAMPYSLPFKLDAESVGNADTSTSCAYVKLTRRDQ